MGHYWREIRSDFDENRRVQTGWIAQVDEKGRLVVPEEVAARFGWKPGALVELHEDGNELRLTRPVTSLARIYVELTNACNLDCTICIRNAWNEPTGWMSEQTFQHVISSLRMISPRPTLFLGGFGEPLAHPRLKDWIRQAKDSGAMIELITNGTLLDEAMIIQLVESGLDVLWVSIDGATPRSYQDVRLSSELDQIKANLKRFQELRLRHAWTKPKLGIAFVAMKRNIQDLPAVIQLGLHAGADRFSVSNVLPYTHQMQDEILYARSLYSFYAQSPERGVVIHLPRMDTTPQTADALESVLRGEYLIDFYGSGVTRRVNRCPFVERGSLAIRWDGKVSPCLSLLHSHVSYLGERQRNSQAYFIGDISESELLNIWNDPAFVALRRRLRSFDFSPCCYCNSCEHADQNLEDCFGNIAPTCGGCLWAQGFIQCP